MAIFRDSRKGKGLQQHAVALLLSALTLPVFAADISVSARDVNEATWKNGGLQVKYSSQAKVLGQAARYRATQVFYAPGRIIDMAVDSAKKNPGATAVSLAVTGAVAAAGWTIDELSGQVMTTAGGASSDYSYKMPGYDYVSLSEVQSQCLAYASASSSAAGWEGVRNETVTGSGANLYCEYETALNGNWYAQSQPFLTQACSVDPTKCQSAEAVTDEELAGVLSTALADMSAAELRDFFKNGGYLPSLSPELNAALQDWANDIADETGLSATDAAEQANARDTPQEIQDVRITDPVTIDEAGVPEASIKDKYEGDGFNQLHDMLDPSTEGIGFGIDIPELPESTGTCRKIDWSFFGYNYEIPNQTGCSYLAKLREILAYFFYIATFLYCMEIFFNRKTA